ncbi:MAG: hypothetical protein RL701_2554 [Pseudomonadota bacterium]|jgi:hypothetical protein
MHQVVVAALALFHVVACAVAHDVGDGVPLGEDLGPIKLDQRCLSELDDAPLVLPDHLSCTGLYRDVAQRKVADGVLSFVPGYVLWSDGLDKSRYLYLPKNTTIDASTPGYWEFPVGTRFWKEFRAHETGRPVETRIFLKTGPTTWRPSSYAWNDTLTDATRVDVARNVDLGSQVHWIPSPNDCDKCHKGRPDRVLGFEQVALGLPEASGVTLADLVAQQRLTGFSGPTDYHIGEQDNDSVEAHALGFLHMNCGVSCHNNNSNAYGGMARLQLKLEPEQLDGRSSSSFVSVTNTVGMATKTLRWSGKTRIVPGSSADSWLYTLMTQRGDPEEQMPPIATNIAPPEGSKWVKDWIDSLPKQ